MGQPGLDVQVLSSDGGASLISFGFCWELLKIPVQFLTIARSASDQCLGSGWNGSIRGIWGYTGQKLCVCVASAMQSIKRLAQRDLRLVFVALAWFGRAVLPS